MEKSSIGVKPMTIALQRDFLTSILFQRHLNPGSPSLCEVQTIMVLLVCLK
uniref:Uncharacterized protein n=1 Tax=Rhizophora mucronata TaxID=61149 RepID=A0A2P2NG95_RHIMU